jgi:hypothetical protein
MKRVTGVPLATAGATVTAAPEVVGIGENEEAAPGNVLLFAVS